MKSYICSYCGQPRELSNRSKHLRFKHPEHYTSRADRHRLIPPDGSTATPNLEDFMLQSILRILPSGGLPEKVKSINWKLLNDINDKESLKTLWKESTTTLPHLLPTKECWFGIVPKDDDVYKHTINTMNSSTDETRLFYVCDKDGYEGNIGEAFLQVRCKPNRDNPTYVANLSLSMEGTSGMKFPEHPGLPTLQQHSAPQIMMTPMHTFVDLRIGCFLDHGIDVLATAIEPCEIVWFLFPPTDLNLSLYSSHEHIQHKRFLLYASKLEGGLIVQTPAYLTLHIPAGTIYASLTTKAGFVATQSFLSAEALPTMARYLTFSL